MTTSTETPPTASVRVVILGPQNSKYLSYSKGPKGSEKRGYVGMNGAVVEFVTPSAAAFRFEPAGDKTATEVATEFAISQGWTVVQNF